MKRTGWPFTHQCTSWPQQIHATFSQRYDILKAFTRAASFLRLIMVNSNTQFCFTVCNLGGTDDFSPLPNPYTVLATAGLQTRDQNILNSFRCSLWSSVSEEHLMGPSMSAYHIFPRRQVSCVTRESLLQNKDILSLLFLLLLFLLLLLLFIFLLLIILSYSLALLSWDWTPLFLHYLGLYHPSLRKIETGPKELHHSWDKMSSGDYAPFGSHLGHTQNAYSKPGLFNLYCPGPSPGCLLCWGHGSSACWCRGFVPWTTFPSAFALGLDTQVLPSAWLH
jgi:hypothetical protein